MITLDSGTSGTDATYHQPQPHSGCDGYTQLQREIIIYNKNEKKNEGEKYEKGKHESNRFTCAKVVISDNNEEY